MTLPPPLPAPDVAKLPRWTERVGENAQTMAVLRADLEQSVGRHQRAIEALTGHIGRPGVLYGMIVCAWLWMLYNTLAPWLHLTQLDAPPFFWLQGAFCFVALTVTLLVLITQNRQEHRAERYAQLDLQINMLAEQKEAKIIALLEELRRDLPMVRNRRDSVAEAMIEPTNHQEVFLALEASMEYVVVKE